MNVHLGMAVTSAAIFVLLGCMHAQAKKHHDSQLEADQAKTPEVRRKHQGKVDSFYTKRYQFFVNLNEIDSWSAYKSSSKVGEKMTAEQLDMLWQKMVEDLPAGTDFSISEATIEKGNRSTVDMYLDKSSSEGSIPRSDLITAVFPGGEFGYSIELVPGLKEYADFEKWDKETGFDAAQRHLLEKHPILRLTFAIEEIVQDGEQNVEGYRQVLERVGIHVPIQNLIVLPDGSRATETLADIDRLNSLNNENSVVNIIPDLRGRWSMKSR